MKTKTGKKCGHRVCHTIYKIYKDFEAFFIFAPCSKLLYSTALCSFFITKNCGTVNNKKVHSKRGLSFAQWIKVKSWPFFKLKKTKTKTGLKCLRRVFHTVYQLFKDLKA